MGSYDLLWSKNHPVDVQFRESFYNVLSILKIILKTNKKTKNLFLFQNTIHSKQDETENWAVIMQLTQLFVVQNDKTPSRLLQGNLSSQAK